MKKKIKRIIKIHKDNSTVILELTDDSYMPDPGDIPGGALHGRDDMLDSIYSAWKDKLIGKRIEEWMKSKHRTTFP